MFSVAIVADQMEYVLYDHVPHQLDRHLDKDEVDDNDLQAGSVCVGALRTKHIQQLPQYVLDETNLDVEQTEHIFPSASVASEVLYICATVRLLRSRWYKITNESQC